MFHDPIVLAAIALMIVAVAAAQLFKGRRTFPYEAAGPLLSPAEQRFYRVLLRAVVPGQLVMPKVRVADLIRVKGRIKQDSPGRHSEFWRAFGQIAQKHVDFTVVDGTSFRAVIAVELDDASHGAKGARVNDDVKNRAFAAAGLPVVRFRTGRSYAVDEVVAVLTQAVSPT